MPSFLVNIHNQELLDYIVFKHLRDEGVKKETLFWGLYPRNSPKLVGAIGPVPNRDFVRMSDLLSLQCG